MKGFSIIISFGRYGGFYFYRSDYSKRLCLGWMAITFLPEDIDELFEKLLNEEAAGKKEILEVVGEKTRFSAENRLKIG